MLTVKQERFVLGLVEGKSQREAYKAAYTAGRMKDKTIDERACRLLKEEKVRARYDELRGRVMQAAEQQAVVSVAQTLEELKDIAYVGWDDPRVTGKQIVLRDKLKALELLGRHLGLFTDKVALSGELSIADALEAARKRASQARGER